MKLIIISSFHESGALYNGGLDEMLGAITGDIIGSIYEGNSIKTQNFKLLSQECEFTDDTILTLAVAYSILEKIDYEKSLKAFGKKYDASYGGYFIAKPWV